MLRRALVVIVGALIVALLPTDGLSSAIALPLQMYGVAQSCQDFHCEQTGWARCDLSTGNLSVVFPTSRDAPYTPFATMPATRDVVGVYYNSENEGYELEWDVISSNTVPWKATGNRAQLTPPKKQTTYAVRWFCVGASEQMFLGTYSFPVDDGGKAYNTTFAVLNTELRKFTDLLTYEGFGDAGQAFHSRNSTYYGITILPPRQLRAFSLKTQKMTLRTLAYAHDLGDGQMVGLAVVGDKLVGVFKPQTLDAPKAVTIDPETGSVSVIGSFAEGTLSVYDPEVELALVSTTLVLSGYCKAGSSGSDLVRCLSSFDVAKRAATGWVPIGDQTGPETDNLSFLFSW